MERRRGSLALAAALVAGAAAAEPRVTGRVVIATSGAPAAGAEVRLTEAGLLTHADGEGHFVFEGVDPGAGITIHVHLGFLSGEVTYVPDVRRGLRFPNGSRGTARWRIPCWKKNSGRMSIS